MLNGSRRTDIPHRANADAPVQPHGRESEKFGVRNQILLPKAMRVAGKICYPHCVSEFIAMVSIRN